MYFKYLDEPIYFLHLNKISKELKMYYLTEILFYKNPIFFHYHTDEENKETSILVSAETITPEFLSFFDHESIDIYNCLQITNTMDFLNESGLVNKISLMFSKENISILYITTLKSNFILYDKKDDGKVRNIIEKNIL